METIKIRISDDTITGFGRNLVVSNLTINFKDMLAIVYFEIEYILNDSTIDLKIDVPDKIIVDNSTIIPLRDSELNKIEDPEYVEIEGEDNGDKYLTGPAYDILLEMLGDPTEALTKFIKMEDLEGKFDFKK